MESKYYKSSVKEFCIGFEYESSGNDGDGWCKDIINDKYELIQALDDDLFYAFRTKYLDKEDIESFGFKPSAEYGDYIEFNKVGKFITTKLLYNTDSNIMDIETMFLEHISSRTLFSGKIKNKSELKKLLIQLEIINE